MIKLLLNNFSWFKKMKNVAFVFAFFMTAITQAQVTTNGGSGLATTYPDLASAITALNAATIVSPVVITTTVNETAPAGGYSITATGTAANTILIKGTGATITAPTTQVVGSLVDALIKIIGGDYITIEGFTLNENVANTITAAATNTMTEFGIAMFYANATNGAQNNTILNNTISLRRTYQNSFGIYSNTRHNASSITTTADATTAAGSNSFNKFYGNNISNVNYGTVIVGSGAPTANAAMDNGNDIGGTSAATGNIYTNWGGANVVPSGYVGLTGSNYCIFSNNNYNDNISYNNITSATGLTSGITIGGILKNYSTGTTVQPTGTITTNINYNTVSISNNPSIATTGAIIGINNQGLSPLLSTATLNMNFNTVKNCTSGGTVSTTNGITGITNLSLPGVVNMNNNTISNLAVTATTATSGTVVAISNSGAAGTVNMNDNTVTGLSTSGTTTAQIQGVVNSGAAIAAINIKNNILGNATTPFAIRTAVSTTAATFGVLSSGGVAATTVTTIDNNEFYAINYNFASTGAVQLITQSGTVLSATITNNKFNSMSVNTTGSMFLINNNSSTNNFTVSGNNTIGTIAKTGAGGLFYGYYNFGSPTGGTGLITNNNFSNISVTGATTFYGIRQYTSTTQIENITNNTINTITAGSATAYGIAHGYGATGSVVSGNTVTNITGTAEVNGIQLGDGTAGSVNCFNNNINGLKTTGAFTSNGILNSNAILNNIYKNKIYNIEGNNAAAFATGINITAGVAVNIYNNVIGDIKAPISNLPDAVQGIKVNSTTSLASNKIYNNSVYLNATSTGANFGTSGIFHLGNATATTGALDLRNNIIINESVANGTGATVAFRRSLAALTNYDTNSNRNLLSAGTPSPSSFIYANGGTDSSTFAVFQAAVTPRETGSFTSEAAFTYATSGSFFISLTPTSADYLKPVVGITTQVESGASVITSPAITDDYASVIRGANAGYTGTGTNPDIGAFEFEGVTPTPLITITSIAPALTPLCVTTPRLITANITTAAGTISTAVINYAFNGTAQPAITMTNTSGSTFQGTIPMASPANAIVTWSITATNSLPLSKILAGTSYSDELLLGFTKTATAAPATICEGSSTVLTVSVLPNTPTTYVTPTAVTNPTADEDLGEIIISQGATIVLKNTTPINSLVGTIGAATGTAGSYSNFTSFGPYGLNVGQTYNLSLKSLQGTTPYNNSMAVYIDYNQNGVFTDVGEAVYVASANISGAHTETSTFTISPTALNGVTRMRVISNEGLVTGPNMTVAYGEFEEYSVNIVSNNSGAGSLVVSWSDGVSTVGTGTSLMVSPTTTKTYTANITANGCVVTPSPTVTVTVNAAPTVIATAPAAVCAPATVDLTAAAVTTGSTAGLTNTYFTNMAATISVASPTMVATSGTYYIKGTTPAGCFTVTSVVVTVNAVPIVIATAPAAVCAPATVDLTAAAVTTGSTAGLTYTYFTDMAATISVASPTMVATSDTYYIKGTTPQGCFTVTSVLVTVNAEPTVITTAPAAVCAPVTVDLTAAAVTTGSTAGLTYTYFTDMAATIAVASPTMVATSGTYYIKGTTPAGCFTVTSVVATVNEAPTVITTAPAPVCAPATIDLTAATVTTGSTAGLTYTYFTDMAATIAVASPTMVATSGTYYIKGTTPQGCFTVTSVVVTVNSPTSDTTTVVTCNSYTWAVNGTSYTSSGTYTFNGTNANGCADVKTLVLTINLSTTTTTTATVCNSYVWAENGQTYTSTGTYTNVTTNAAGCTNTATLNLTVTNASIDFANLQFPNTSTICSGSSSTAYGQVYEAGLTEAAGAATGIEVEFATNATNTNPNTWTGWAAATFNVQAGNNDEYSATFGSALAPGTYYYTFRYRLIGCSAWQYGGTNNGFWNGTTNNSGVLTINPAVSVPIGAATQTINGATSTTVSQIVATPSSGATLVWFATAADAATGTNPLSASTILVSGNTYYAVSEITPCRSIALAVTVTVVLGTEGFDITELVSYPNPVLDVLNVKYNKNITKVQLFDLTGRLIQSFEPNSTEIQINMSELQNAMYIVKLQADEATTELKVFKK